MSKYPDLKSYLQVNYKDLMQNAIQKLVNNKYDGNGFHSINVLSLCKHEIDNLEVRSLTCHDDIGPRINMDVGVAVDIVELGLGTTRYESSRKKHWFTVSLQGVLKDGLSNVQVLDTSEIYGGKFKKENAVNQFLVPYIRSDQLEDIADDFRKCYISSEHIGYQFPVGRFIKDNDIDVQEADLPDDCLGRIYFKKSKAIVYPRSSFKTCSDSEEIEINPGTVLISHQRYFLGNDGTHLLTIVHEIVHWHFHENYFRLLELLDSENLMTSCDVEPCNYNDKMSPAQKAHWFAEWQANALAIRIAMPRELVKKALQESYRDLPPSILPVNAVEEILKNVAKLFGVSQFVAKQRVRQLDFDAVDGAFVRVDGKTYPPFIFKKNTLGQHQSFLIDQASYKKLYRTNSDFSLLIDSGKFIYLGYVTCINDPKYIEVEQLGQEVRLVLSSYAREHAEECCLVYSWRGKTRLKKKFEFYGQAFLCKDVSADSYVEHSYDKNFNEKCLQTAEDISLEVDKYMKAMDAHNKTLNELSKYTTFAEALKYHMERKKISVEVLAERSGLSDTTIKNYRSGEVNPPIENVMAVCIGLNLSKVYSFNLLEFADYSIDRDSPRNRAYKFLLDYSDGTLEQWNQILDFFHQPHIPNKRNQRKTEK